jgi:hypothetical protein
MIFYEKSGNATDIIKSSPCFAVSIVTTVTNTFIYHAWLDD